MQCILLIIAGEASSKLGERLIDSWPLRVPRKDVSTLIDFFQKVGTIIEVVRSSERAGFLNSSAEGIVLEAGRSAVGAGDHRLHQPVLEVPGEAAALSVGEGIAVCVVQVTRQVSFGDAMHFAIRGHNTLQLQLTKAVLPVEELGNVHLLPARKTLPQPLKGGVLCRKPVRASSVYARVFGEMIRGHGPRCTIAKLWRTGMIGAKRRLSA